MGKFGSELVPFLEEGLEYKKYGLQLTYSDEVCRKFKLSIPRVGKKMELKKLKIVKDWKERNHDEGDGYKNELKTPKDFSDAKQAFLMALRNSVFIEFVSSGENWLEYRFLTKEEIKNKRENKKSKEKKNSLEKRTSSVDSGYMSLKESPGPSSQVISEDESNNFFATEDQSPSGESHHENHNLLGMNNKLDIVQLSSFEAEFEKNWDEKMEIEHGYLGVDNKLVVVHPSISDSDFERWDDITELLQLDYALLPSNDDFLRLLDKVTKSKLGCSANLKGINRFLDLLQPGSCNADYEQRCDEIKKFLESESDPPDNVKPFSSGVEEFCREWDTFMKSEPICFGMLKKKFPLFKFDRECLFGSTNLLIFKPTVYELIYDMELDFELSIDFFPGIFADKDLFEKLRSGHVSHIQSIDDNLMLCFENDMRRETLPYIEQNSIVSDYKLFVGSDHFIFYHANI